MGYPLSTFSSLSRLCQNDEIVKKEFSTYRVVAIIVHDKEDREFQWKLKNSFEYLHRVTGKSMAFLAFVTPAHRWIRDNKDWMQYQAGLVSGTDSDTYFLKLLRDNLCLPPDPCLVLSTDLMSENFLIMPTCTESFEGQIEAVARYANSQSDAFPITDEGFLDFLDTIGEVYPENTEDCRSLAHNIADLTAVKSMGATNAEELEWVRAHLSRMLSDVETAKTKEPDNEDVWNLLFKYTEYLTFVFRKRIPNSALNITTPLYIDESPFSYFEELSKGYLSDYNLIAQAFAGNPRDKFIPHDLSPLGCYLGKATEEELNASVVQLMRCILGITMPEYYRKYMANRGSCLIKTPSRDVYLNNYRQGYRRPDVSMDGYPDKILAMGEITNVIKILRETEEYDYSLGWFGSDEFINMVNRFSNIRNKASHSGSSFSEDDALELQRQFNDMGREFFPLLAQLKDKLKNEGGVNGFSDYDSYCHCISTRKVCKISYSSRYISMKPNQNE